MKKYIYKTFSLVLAIVFLSSCLKDDRMVLDPDKGHNVVEFANVSTIVSSVGAVHPVYVPKTLELVPESEFEIKVSYSGPEEVAPEDIVVELEAASDVIGVYNENESGTDYNPLAAEAFEIPQTITIKKGESKGVGIVTVKPELMDQTVSNALALRIKSVSSGIISGNFGAVIFSLPIKSVWEGTYKYYVNNNYGTIDGNVGGEMTVEGVTLSTVGPNRVRVDGLAQTYSGWVEYTFNSENDEITSVTAFSGSLLPTSIQEVITVDPENGVFEFRWTWLGRGTLERWEKTGD